MKYTDFILDQEVQRSRKKNLNLNKKNNLIKVLREKDISLQRNIFIFYMNKY